MVDDSPRLLGKGIDLRDGEKTEGSQFKPSWRADLVAENSFPHLDSSTNEIDSLSSTDKSSSSSIGSQDVFKLLESLVALDRGFDEGSKVLFDAGSELSSTAHQAVERVLSWWKEERRVDKKGERRWSSSQSKRDEGEGGMDERVRLAL